MAEIIAAIDEGTANTFLGATIGALPPLSDSGSGNLGPFVASYSVSAMVSAGVRALGPRPEIDTMWTIAPPLSSIHGNAARDARTLAIYGEAPDLGRVTHFDHTGRTVVGTSDDIAGLRRRCAFNLDFERESGRDAGDKGGVAEQKKRGQIA